MYEYQDFDHVSRLPAFHPACLQDQPIFALDEDA
jgi:hypothetical protein